MDPSGDRQRVFSAHFNNAYQALMARGLSHNEAAAQALVEASRNATAAPRAAAAPSAATGVTAGERGGMDVQGPEESHKDSDDELPDLVASSDGEDQGDGDVNLPDLVHPALSFGSHDRGGGGDSDDELPDLVGGSADGDDLPDLGDEESEGGSNGDDLPDLVAGSGNDDDDEPPDLATSDSSTESEPPGQDDSPGEDPDHEPPDLLSDTDSDTDRHGEDEEDQDDEQEEEAGGGVASAATQSGAEARAGNAETISAASILGMVDACRREGSCLQLIHFVGRAFCSPEVVSRSFRQPRTATARSQDARGEGSGVAGDGPAATGAEGPNQDHGSSQSAATSHPRPDEGSAGPSPGPGPGASAAAGMEVESEAGPHVAGRGEPADPGQATEPPLTTGRVSTLAALAAAAAVAAAPPPPPPPCPAPAPAPPSPGAASDPSGIAFDVEAATGAWEAVYGAGHEGVVGAARNALQALAHASAKPWGGAAAVAARSSQSRDRSRGGGELRRVAELRPLLFMLENPQLQDPDFEPVLRVLFNTLAGLRPGLRRRLVRWFTALDKDRFARYLGSIQQYITLKVYAGAGSDGVLSAVKTMELLYLADLEENKVPYQDFYNDAINEELFSDRVEAAHNYNSWIDDQKAMAQGSKQLQSLISYSFVLDPASKASTLDLDSRVQMRRQLNNEIQEALSMGVIPMVSPYLVLRVRRNSIVEDSLHALVLQPDKELKKPLRVQFVGEEGVDEGGVQKEYFQVMLRELLDPKYSMFKQEAETRTLWFNSDSLEAGEEFELVGMLLGIAIYNSIILDVRFPLVVYKMLMGQKPTLEDLKDAQPTLGKGLQQLLDFEGDVENVFCRIFQISYEVFGAVKTIDLMQGGGEKPVTSANRDDYVRLYVDWVLRKSVESQLRAFQRGFHKVVGGAALRLFRSEELERLVCGSPILDFEAWERVTQYEDGYNKDSPTIKQFWEVVHDFNEESKRKLLKFATGSDRAPINGLQTVLLVISKNGADSDRLPTAHTCFNHLLLPCYASKEKLADRLRLAIEQSEGFGLR